MPRKKVATKKKGFANRNRRKKYDLNTKFKSKFEGFISEALHNAGVEPNYESTSIEYTQIRKYTPDFTLVSADGTKTIIVEAKGLFDTEDRRKHVDVKAQYPQHDIRFVFYADYKLYRGGKSKYSDWCTKHGFKYSIGYIPNEWLEELGYDVKPKEEDTTKDE